MTEMTKTERDAILDRFEAERLEHDEGLLIRTYDIELDERNAFFLGPDGDYCLQVGKDYEASFVTHGNGTTQITIRRMKDGG